MTLTKTPVIKQHLFLAVTIVALLWIAAKTTPNETPLDSLPKTTLTSVVFVHTSTVNPLPVATVTATAQRITAVQVEPTTTIPEPRRWTGPIPAHYGPGSACTPAQAQIVADHMWRANASDDTITWMLSMISRESTCDSAAHNNNRNTGDDSWGLCQINALAGHFNVNGIVAEFDRYRFATDFEYNTAACVKLWSVCGRGPWNYGDYYCRSEP